MPDGIENQMLRERLAAFAARKTGRGNNMRIATLAQQEGYTQYVTKLMRLPRGVPLIIQNADGTYSDYMPGIDGPVNLEI